MLHFVNVRDTFCEVTAEQASESVWIAVGELMGKCLEFEASSEKAAVTGWKNAVLKLDR